MFGYASIGTNISRVDIIVGGVTKELSCSVTGTAKGQAGIRVGKFRRNTVASSYIQACIEENDGKNHPKEPEPKDIKIIHFDPCLGWLCIGPFRVFIRVFQGSFWVEIDEGKPQTDSDTVVEACHREKNRKGPRCLTR